MSKKRNDLLRDKRLVYTLGICLLIFIVVSMVIFFHKKEDINEEKNINNLTTKYNQDHNIKGSDEIAQDTILDSEKDNSKIVDDSEKIDLDETQETYENINIKELDENSAKREADDFTLFFSERINSKSYNELYNILNREYVKDFNYSMEMFEFEYSFNGDISTEVTNVEVSKDKDRIFITAKLIEKANGAFTVVDFTIFSDGTIADMRIDYIANLEDKTEIDNVVYNVSKRIDTRLGSIFKIDIENNSDKLIKIDDMLIKDGSVIYSYEIISNNKVLESYPGIPFSFMIKIPNTTTVDYIELQGKDFNEKPYKIVILDENGLE